MSSTTVRLPSTETGDHSWNGTICGGTGHSIAPAGPHRSKQQRNSFRIGKVAKETGVEIDAMVGGDLRQMEVYLKNSPVDLLIRQL